MDKDEEYLQLCFDLAADGKGSVSPNPMVGCVIVKNHRVMASGYHSVFGGPHAEINAFNNSKANVEGATLYVNLEPCSHYGKTPPCVDAIIAKKIARVVIGTLDPNPLVSGRGVQKLKEAGIEVLSGVLETECRELNKFFLKHIQTKLPYVTLKIAQTLDGKIATRTNDSKWITCEESRRHVHRLRSEYDAVLIGSGTAKIDNPELTVRMCEGRNPKRIVLDSNLSLPLSLKLFTQNPEKNVIVVTGKDIIAVKKNKVKQLEKLGVAVIPVARGADKKINIQAALKALGARGISSVLVEGGGKIYTAFLSAGLADEMNVFVAPKFFGDGIPAIGSLSVSKAAKALTFRLQSSQNFGSDVLLDLRKR